MDFDVQHVENERLARALERLRAGERDLAKATADLQKRLDEHARSALQAGVIDFGSSLLAHRR